MTHFHLLVESVDGRLGDAMQRLEGIYARGFNRRRPSRDGHLLRGRYWIRRVKSDAYQTALVRYIDMNPVVAGLVTDPADYPFGSAALYQRTRGPGWLDRAWVEGQVCRRLGLAAYDPVGYRRCFGTSGAPGQRRWFEDLLSSGSVEDTPSLDELVQATPEGVLRWMDERAREADGTSRKTPLADPESVIQIVEEAERRTPGWTLRSRRRPRPAFPILVVGLLRDVGGQTFSKIGVRAAIHKRVAVDRYAEHRLFYATDATYRTVAAELATAVLRRCHADPRSPPESV